MFKKLQRFWIMCHALNHISRIQYLLENLESRGNYAHYKNALDNHTHKLNVALRKLQKLEK